MDSMTERTPCGGPAASPNGRMVAPLPRMTEELPPLALRRSGAWGPLVIVGVVAVFGSIPLLFRGEASFRRMAQKAEARVACMKNVRYIGQSMLMYAGDHDDGFMDVVDAAGSKVPTASIVPTEPSRSGFVLLLNEGYLTSTKVFICPDSTDAVNPKFPEDLKGSTLRQLLEGLGEKNCSYGWDPTKKHSADATCAILADKPRVKPGKEGTAANNSENHGGDGQNVYYNDGHVKWGTTPKPDAGDDPDIYTGAADYETSIDDAKIIR